MKPVSFPETNILFAKGQPQYLQLPAFRDYEGMVITCWQMTWKERIRALVTGRLWLSQLTFNTPLQPQRPSLERPFLRTSTPIEEAQS